MKKPFPLLILFPLLAALLPPGSAKEPLPEPAAPAETAQVHALMERSADGALQIYQPEDPQTYGILPTDDGLLVFSGREQTTVTRYTGSPLTYAGSVTLAGQVSMAEGFLSRVDFFFREGSTLVRMDHRLRETGRWELPEDLSGTAIPSADGSRIFYCTDTALRVLETETGINRVLREMAYGNQQVSQTAMDDTLVLVTFVTAEGSQETLCIHTESGQLQAQLPGQMGLWDAEGRWYACISRGHTQSLLFGEAFQDPQELLVPLAAQGSVFLPEENAAIVPAEGAEGFSLHRYDLNTGRRTASVELAGLPAPYGICGKGDTVWFLAGTEDPLLYRWDTPASPVEDPADHTQAYHTRDNPDVEGLVRCADYARQLSEKHGVEILIYEDAVAVQPSDRILTEEYRVPLLEDALTRLDENLSHYPEGFLRTLSGRFDGLKICLVASVTGGDPAEDPHSSLGAGFRDGYTPYIVLSTGADTRQVLYHELCHLIDTVVLNESIAYDQWNKLNPAGFSYGNHGQRGETLWLEGSSRCFIDTYSMGYPMEDRARIMEYAMIPGNEEYFRSLAMQSKLLALCQGIREAFRLEQWPEGFLWEQYLNTSLAWTEEK